MLRVQSWTAWCPQAITHAAIGFWSCAVIVNHAHILVCKQARHRNTAVKHKFVTLSAKFMADLGLAQEQVQTQLSNLRQGAQPLWATQQMKLASSTEPLPLPCVQLDLTCYNMHVELVHS